jgi:hypothetical protein
MPKLKRESEAIGIVCLATGTATGFRRPPTFAGNVQLASIRKAQRAALAGQSGEEDRQQTADGNRDAHEQEQMDSASEYVEGIVPGTAFSALAPQVRSSHAVG